MIRAAALAVSLAASTGTGDDVLRPMLDHPPLQPVIERADEYKLQIVVGLVEQTDDGPVLTQHTFGDDEPYFYPASAVKLCAAISALEWLHEVDERTPLDITPTTPMVFHPLFDDEVHEDSDDSNLDGGTITIAHEIRKLFIVSDNRAFNRLYEFVGQQRLNHSMQAAGIDSAHIVHRLSEYRTPEGNRQSPRIDFIVGDELCTIPERTSPVEMPLLDRPGLLIGDGYMSRGELVGEPLDFADNNSISLADLQRVLCKVVRPDVDCAGEPFALTGDDRALLLDAMSALPRDSDNPIYDPETYPDDWGKFVLPGLRRVADAGDIRVYNKIGRAYGFSTENAYVVNTKTGEAFFLACVLYTNDNRVLNDNVYEYESVADPFLADLAEAAARALWTTP